MKARSEAPRVGFVGLGRMGRPMAARLHGAGFAVTGFDADQAAAERFGAESGLKICSAAGVNTPPVCSLSVRSSGRLAGSSRNSSE